MLDTNAKIIPVFYEVEPWELRHIEKGQYAAAFIKYEENGRYIEKLSQWKEALQSLSFIAGQVFHSSSDCESIVAAIQKEFSRKRHLHVAEYPVGLNNMVKDFERQCLGELVQDFEYQCGLQEKKPKIVGIFGMGGIGKTTLVKELFNRKHSSYSRAGFLFDVREASVRRELCSLQSQLLKDLFHQDRSFRSVDEGTSYLSDCLKLDIEKGRDKEERTSNLQRSPSTRFLVVLDDIDHVDQLNALLVMDMIAKPVNCLVLVTTRDVGVVVNAGISVGYPLRGMGTNQGRQLFCWHAFGEPNPQIGYETLVDEFVEVCSGLPLSLQVLGRHVHGRAHSYWKLELEKARTTLPRDVMQRLKISFDSLDDEQKQVFMDTACFFVGRPKIIAERVWKGSGWNAQHALETLKDKCLVEERDEMSREEYNPREIVLRMHDHLRDLGREMANELKPPNRLWRPQDLQSLESMDFKTILTKTNIRCFHSLCNKSTFSQVTFFIGQLDSCAQTSTSLLWLQIDGKLPDIASIRSRIPLQKLQDFIIEGLGLTLSEHCMQVPSQLKEPQISQTSLKKFLKCSGIFDKLKNTLLGARGLPSAGMSCGPHHPGLSCLTLNKIGKLGEVDLRMVKTLNFLEITACRNLKSLSGISDLVELKISDCKELESLCLNGMHQRKLQSITLDLMKKLVKLDLRSLKTLNFLKITMCKSLVSVSGISDLVELVELKISCCEELKIESLCLNGKHQQRLQSITLRRMEKLVKLDLRFLKTLNFLEIKMCISLVSVSGISDLANFVELKISDCWMLEIESPCLNGMHQKILQSITLHRMEKLVKLDLGFLKTLKFLKITRCESLASVSGISDLSNLVELKISDCKMLEIESLCLNGMHQPRLQSINLHRMEKLVNLDLRFLKALKFLEITQCESLVRVSGISDLSNLVELKISDCEMLEIEWQRLYSHENALSYEKKDLVIFFKS